jgi:L-alanine-DL-glutamate epimerase-like enolase superfamily enzyme
MLSRVPLGNPAEFIRTLWHQSADEPGKYGAICALELALFDLWGRQEGKPVAELLRPGALNSDRTPSYSAVYPFASGLKLTALHVLYGTLIKAEHIKVKGSGRITEDLAYVAAVRRAHPYPVDVRLDLNGSLHPDHAEEYFSRMLNARHGVRWFEQPFPKHAWEASTAFQKRFTPDLVFCADESVCSMDDLEHAITTGAFRAINIRVAKNGGLLNALKLYQRARQKGLETQLGCMVGESSVLAYAGLHLAVLADQLRYYEGCFGKYLVKWDVIQPSLTFSRGGRVPLTRLPKAGLVPTFDVRRLKQRAYESGLLGGSP